LNGLVRSYHTKHMPLFTNHPDASLLPPPNWAPALYPTDQHQNVLIDTFSVSRLILESHWIYCSRRASTVTNLQASCPKIRFTPASPVQTTKTGGNHEKTSIYCTNWSEPCLQQCRIFEASQWFWPAHGKTIRLVWPTSCRPC
jgi:hypothetical protein